MKSINPATGETIWEDEQTTPKQIKDSVQFLRDTFSKPSSLSQRATQLRQLKKVFSSRQKELVEAISIETGKTLWESKAEVGACIGKIDFSIDAFQQRCRDLSQSTDNNHSELYHKPIGIMAVYGPYNFPIHLPNGHIIPALLAGNSIVFKPSDQTPRVGELLVDCMRQANIGENQLQIVQGSATTGKTLASQQQLDGILFTGSYQTGKILHQNYAGQTNKMLALEMGGNNPLVIDEVNNLDAVVFHTIMSAYVTTGQRCTCARRLIIVKSKNTTALLKKLKTAVTDLVIGSYFDSPEPFMGPLINNAAADDVIKSHQKLVNLGAQALIESTRFQTDLPFLSPGLVDVTGLKNLADEEVFGPLLQITIVSSFEEALAEANNTQYGLAAGILTKNNKHWQQYKMCVRAGIINRNLPTTGAKGNVPFGGLGHSGNFRPSAWYATDYCSYPVASNSCDLLQVPQNVPVGIPF